MGDIRKRFLPQKRSHIWVLESAFKSAFVGYIPKYEICPHLFISSSSSFLLPVTVRFSPSPLLFLFLAFRSCSCSCSSHCCVSRIPLLRSFTAASSSFVAVVLPSSSVVAAVHCVLVHLGKFLLLPLSVPLFDRLVMHVLACSDFFFHYLSISRDR